MSAEDIVHLNEWFPGWFPNATALGSSASSRTLPPSRSSNDPLFSSTFTNSTSEFFAPDEGTFNPTYSRGANALFSSSVQDACHPGGDAFLSPTRLYGASDRHPDMIPPEGLSRASMDHFDAHTLRTPLELTFSIPMPYMGSSSNADYATTHSGHPVRDDVSGSHVYTTPAEALAHAWTRTGHSGAQAPRTPYQFTPSMPMLHPGRSSNDGYTTSRSSSHPVRDDAFVRHVDTMPSEALARAQTGHSGARKRNRVHLVSGPMGTSRSRYPQRQQDVEPTTAFPVEASASSASFDESEFDRVKQAANEPCAEISQKPRSRKPRAPLPKKHILVDIIGEPIRSTWIVRNANNAVTYYDPHHEDAEDLPEQTINLALFIPVKISKDDDSDDMICQYIDPRWGDDPNYLLCRYIDPVSGEKCRSCFILTEKEKEKERRTSGGNLRCPRNVFRHFKTVHAPREREALDMGTLTLGRAVALKDPKIPLVAQPSAFCSDPKCVHLKNTKEQWKVYERRPDRLVTEHKDQHEERCCAECTPELVSGEYRVH